MELSKIISRLGKYHPKQLTTTNPNIDIFFFQLSEREKSFSPNALYICNVSRLPKLPVEGGLNFLCIKDVEVPKEYLDAKNKLNLITIDRSINTYDAIGILSRIFSDDSRINNARNHLINALHSGKGLQYIVNEAYKLLQNPVIVSDIGYKILAMSQDPEPSNSSNSFIPFSEDENISLPNQGQRNLGYLIENDKQININEKIHEYIRENHYPYYSNDESSEFGRLDSLVYIHGIEVAQIRVMCNKHPADDVDMESLDFLSKIISMELQKDEFYSNTPGLMHSFLLSDFLQGQVRSLEIANNRMRNLKWVLNENLLIMIVADTNRDIFESKAQIISSQLHNILATSRWSIYEGRIVFLLSYKDEPMLESNKRLAEYLENNQLVSSLSPKFSNVLDIPKYYKKAKRAFELGTKLGTKKVIFNYSDYVIYHMGDIISRSNPLSEFYHPNVVAVREYDKKHNGNFLETLELYLEYSDRTDLIAQKLFIHKNTVLYRINKLKEQFDLDLENGEERLKMLLTIKFMKLE